LQVPQDHPARKQASGSRLFTSHSGSFDPSEQACPWDCQKIVFVSGKGGVGKSLIAAGIAKEQAARGRRVLLAEIGETSYYADFWGLSKVGHESIATRDGFDLALWSGESCLREYVLFYLRVERLYKLFFENKVMRALVNVAPGLAEIAILGKITSGIRNVGPALNYDLIVVDSYATGHALALFQAPKGMMEAIKFGPMGHHSREMEKVIENPSLCGYVVVTLLEELPVAETIEFHAALKAALGVEATIVANKVVTAPVPDVDLKAIESAQATGLGEFTRYLLAVTARQRTFLEQLGRLGQRILQVPLIFSTEPSELVSQTEEALRKV
jgi:hypothetical protein